MVRAGLTSRQAFLLITFVSAICATIGILGEIYYVNEWAMFVGFFILFFLMYIQLRVHGELLVG